MYFELRFFQIALAFTEIMVHKCLTDRSYLKRTPLFFENLLQERSTTCCNRKCNENQIFHGDNLSEKEIVPVMLQSY